MKFFITTSAIGLLAPLFVLAAPRNLFDVIGIIFNLLAALIPVIFTLALIFFLWGAAKYILKSDDATAQKEGRKFMLYGIIALFVMVSIGGLVGILGRTFDVETRGFPFLPEETGGPSLDDMRGNSL
ncbi:MAG: hypothetical protein WD003_01860 [Candidatus Paceibacterota bacterium]